MKSINQWRLLPHEIFFGLYLVSAWLRLSLVESPLHPDALLYLGMLVLNAAAIMFGSGERPWRWRLRLLYYPVAMNVVYFSMKTAIPTISPVPMDGLLQRADSFLIGGDLSVRLQSLANPMATEFFSACYVLFFPYMLISIVAYSIGELELMKKFFVGLFTIYGIGFLGYSIMPAAGPWSALASQFVVPLKGGWITGLNAAVVARGSNGVDVFPSLHCAISAYLLFFDYEHRRWRFRSCLVPCVGLWCSTIYLRYHYLIDVLCGFALAGFALWLASRYLRPLQACHSPSAARTETKTETCPST